MSRAPILIVAVVLAVGAAGAGAWFAARLNPPALPEHARILSAPRALPEVPATDHAGRPFTPRQFEGRWTIVFFGFTYCPDICPATLQVLATVRQLLADLPEQDQPQVVMISVDPDRDTPARLAEYVPFFDASFRGVQVLEDYLPELARGFGAAYFQTPLGDESYTVDHTASLFLVDRQGRLAAVIPTPHVAEGIASDMRRILKMETSR